MYSWANYGRSILLRRCKSTVLNGAYMRKQAHTYEPYIHLHKLACIHTHTHIGVIRSSSTWELSTASEFRKDIPVIMNTPLVTELGIIILRRGEG